MTKPTQFKVPHCNHCKNFHEYTGNCILILMDRVKSGSQFSAKASGSRFCKSFEPLPAFKENYKEMFEKWHSR